MSVTPAAEPECTQVEKPSVELIIRSRTRAITDAFSVRRLLPSGARRMVGPFIYFDHMGPVVFPPGAGIDVKPHPHIGLATVTYLFEGEILHRDSLGSQQPIRPGDVNWMIAGRGIVHSERTAPERRRDGAALHGLQLWVALPAEQEDAAPDFHHHPAATLPQLEVGGVQLRVLAGSAFGVTSPVRTLSPLFYVDAAMPAGSSMTLEPEYEQRAAYVVTGAIQCAGNAQAGYGEMLVFEPGVPVELRTGQPTRLVLLGGAPLGTRHITWNFVSTSKERIEQAAQAWKERRFPTVPGDETEFVLLP